MTVSDEIRRQLPNAFYPFFGEFSGLRPAQEATIPLVLSGENVLLISPTGSGKTEAMVVPVAEKATQDRRRLTCLYICPTRALVNDIERRVKDKLGRMDLAVGVRHGDRKTMQGKRPPEFLITTPESLDVMLGNDRYKSDLESVNTVIIDEVHQFYQTHRGYQLLLLLERLKWWTKAPLQRLLLSATVAQPAEMARWFQGSDEPLQLVQIPGGRRLEVTLERLTAADGNAFKTGESAIRLIRRITTDHHKVLVFTNSRNECNWLAWKLDGQLHVPVLMHYSNLDQEYRQRVEQRFQKERRAVCVATSTLELGVDIGDVDAVVMYGAPASISSFVQRVGRGNRRRDSSRVYGLCRDYHIDGSYRGAEDDMLLFAALIAAMQDQELETRPPAELYSVVVQQAFSLTSRWERVIPRKIEDALEQAGPQPILSLEEVRQLLDHLAEKGFYRFQANTKEYIKAEEWERVKTSRQLWGNIAQQAYDKVVHAADDIPISDIPRGQAEIGRVFLVAGRPRMVTEVKSALVRTIDLDTSNPELIAYETIGAATPPEVARKAASLLCDESFPDLPIEWEDSLSRSLRAFRRQFRHFPLDEAIPYTRDPRDESQLCYYLFGGTWAHTLAAHALRRHGYRVSFDSLRLYTNRPISDLTHLPKSAADLQQLVDENLLGFIRSMGFSYHFFQLPEERQLGEVCSLLHLPRLAEWFSRLREKEMRLLAGE